MRKAGLGLRMRSREVGVGVGNGPIEDVIDEIESIEGLSPEFKRKLLRLQVGNKTNYKSTINFINDCKIQKNLSLPSIKLNINVICYLDKFVKKEFKDINRDDIISFLDSLRKSEPLDPLHK